jgi:hypothetical protein
VVIGFDQTSLYRAARVSRTVSLCSAARIVANGFRPGRPDAAVFFAEDRATAEFFANNVTVDRSGTNPVVMKFVVPNSIAGEMQRGVIGEFRGFKFVDVAGSNGMERIMTGDMIDLFNAAMQDGTIQVFRIRIPRGF